MVDDRRTCPSWRPVLSCEHASNRLPERYRDLVAREVLETHEGWDPGARTLARSLARTLRAPLIEGRFTRLLVDLNRSRTNPSVFSEATAQLPVGEREELLAAYHAPYRREVRERIEEELARGQRVVHLSVHTFTPVLQGRVRSVDLGVLFDPDAQEEPKLAERMMTALRAALPEARVRANEPYLGTSDGLTRTLRGRLPGDRYAGLELEVTQVWAERGDWEARCQAIGHAVAAALGLRLRP
jgi:predicted N-formylglutamate amidohydrolase